MSHDYDHNNNSNNNANNDNIVMFTLSSDACLMTMIWLLDITLGVMPATMDTMIFITTTPTRDLRGGRGEEI